MALQSVGQMLIPSVTPGPASVNVTTNFDTAQFLMDAAAEKVAMIIRAPRTGTISKIAIRTATVSVGGDADFRLETVDATTGDPTGTLLGTNTNVTVTLNASSTWFTGTLTAGASVTKGDLFAVVIANSSGTYTITSMASGVYRASFPYMGHMTAAWVKFSQAPVLALEYSDTNYYPVLGCMPTSNIVNQAFNTGSVIDERGIKFRLPFPVRVSGAWAQVEADNDFTIRLYDSDGTSVLLSQTCDPEIRFGTNHGIRYEDFASTAILLPNVDYRLTLLPTTASNITSHEVVAPSAAVMAALPWGTSIHLTTRADAGAWTDTTTQRVQMGIIVDQVDYSGGPLIGGRLIR